MATSKSTKKQTERIRSKVPEGKSLPREFKKFVAADLPISIAWISPTRYEFVKAAELEMVPFIHIADGGVVAFWFVDSQVPIVCVDAHGDPARVVAIDLANFLRAISKNKTGIPDIDCDCADIVIKGFDERPVKSGLTTLQRKLTHWCEEHSALQKPTKSIGAEKLRQRVVKIANQMIKDGKSKSYNSKSSWWSMSFQVFRRRTCLEINYLDFGKWKSVPKKYKLEGEVQELLSMVKNPKRRRFDVEVLKIGIVSVDRDKQLVLLPPDEN